MSFVKSIFKYFPTPNFLDMSHSGVDISPTAIRFVELIKTPHGLKLGGFGEQTLPKPLVNGESLVADLDLIAALKKLQRAEQLSLVEVSVPEEKAYIYTTEVPEGDDESIRNNIEFHLEENVPISLADAVYDYFIIRNNEKAGTIFASVSVVPLSVVQEYIDLFAKAGMTVVSFLTENQAMTRAVIAKGDKRTALIVSLGLRKTVLSIVSEEAVQFTTTAPIGSEDFTAAIMKEFGVDAVKAEQIKKEKGFVRSKENEALFLSLISTASALKDEINHIYTYWESNREKNKGNSFITPIDHIILSGQDASIIGFREYIAVSMKTDVELGNVWANLFSFDEEIPPIEYLESLSYGNAIGLALPKQPN